MSDRLNPATVTDYDSLIAALRARADELNVSRLAIDERAGLQSGYTAKLLAGEGGRGLGRLSLGCLLGALGVKLIMVDDPAAAATIALMPKRDLRAVRHKQAAARITARMGLFTAENAGEMGARRWLGIPENKRAAIARRAARARWRKARAA